MQLLHVETTDTLSGKCRVSDLIGQWDKGLPPRDAGLFHARYLEAYAPLLHAGGDVHMPRRTAVITLAVELDALPIDVLEERIVQEIDRRMDLPRWWQSKSKRKANANGCAAYSTAHNAV
jgi:hypothetical protein